MQLKSITIPTPDEDSIWIYRLSLLKEAGIIIAEDEKEFDAEIVSILKLPSLKRGKQNHLK